MSCLDVSNPTNIPLPSNSHNPISYLPMNLFSREKELRTPLQNMRIIQKNLVYLIGLSKELIDKEELLCNFEYLGQFGKIIKFVINKNKTYNENGPNGPSYSCYVTYSSSEESSLAILSLDNAIIDNHVIKASYGTTKYCTNFLKNSVCLNEECLYLHEIADEEDIISRNEMSNNKKIFELQQKKAIELSQIKTERKRKQLEEIRNRRTIFPNAYDVYNKEVVKEYLRKNVKRNRYDLFQSQKESRFDFVQKDVAANSNIKIDVPKKLSSLISKKFIRSVLYKKERDEIIEYYFSKRKASDSNDIWSFLINTLHSLNGDENVSELIKFNSYN